MTPRGADVLRVVRQFISEKGRSPSISEVGAILGIGRVTAYKHLRRLEAEELVWRTPGRKRSVVPIEPRQEGPLDDLLGRAMVAIAMEIEAALVGRVDVERISQVGRTAKEYAKMWIGETLRRAAFAQSEPLPSCPDVVPSPPMAAASTPPIPV
ncbi:MAG: hypothetical protein K8T20_12020 [Planctomycetes bacterium]|nr:hypothetical protein [Planctomycetota bacterium]